MAALRPGGRDRPGGDPGPTGHGVRRARRAAAGQRSVHHDRLPRRLRPHGAVEDPGARPRLIARAADLRRHHPARRGRRRPCHRHRPGRHARHPGRPHRDRARCRQARLRRRPALERGPGRLHERTGHRHHRRAAAEAQRVLDGRRHLRRGGSRVRDELRPARRHGPRRGPRHARRAARAPAPHPCDPRRPRRGGRRHRRHRRIRPRHRHGRHPSQGAAHARRAVDRRSATSCRCSSPPSASRSCR